MQGARSSRVTLSDEIVALDQVNMTPHLRSAGETFDPARRRVDLARELAQGARLLTLRRHDALVAYLEYLPPHDGALRVKSLQVHPAHHGTAVLRPLLAQAADAMDGWPDALLQSGAHASNAASIRLHRGLGFRWVGERDGRFLFEAKVAVLRSTLLRFSSGTPRAATP